jgi:hypothetical protein
MSPTTERAVQVLGDEARRLPRLPHIGGYVVVDAAVYAPKQVVIGQRQAILDRARACPPLRCFRFGPLSSRSIQGLPWHERVGALDLEPGKPPLGDDFEQLSWRHWRHRREGVDRWLHPLGHRRFGAEHHPTDTDRHPAPTLVNRTMLLSPVRLKGGPTGVSTTSLWPWPLKYFIGGWPGAMTGRSASYCASSASARCLRPRPSATTTAPIVPAAVSALATSINGPRCPVSLWHTIPHSAGCFGVLECFHPVKRGGECAMWFQPAIPGPTIRACRRAVGMT